MSEILDLHELTSPVSPLLELAVIHFDPEKDKYNFSKGKEDDLKPGHCPTIILQHQIRCCWKTGPEKQPD